MLKILVADDEKYIRKGLAATITQAGTQFHVCAEAGNGQEAFTLIEEHMPDVVITDIKMPKMDGVELVEKLNTDFPKIRKIILSGFDEFDYVRKSMKNGAVDYLLKPVDEDRVKKLLCSLDEEISAEKKSESENIETQKRINENLQVIKEKFFIDLISGKQSAGEEAAGKRLKQFELPEEAGVYFCIVISMDDYNFLVAENAEETEKKLLELKDVLQPFAANKRVLSPFIYDNNIVILASSDKCCDAPVKSAEKIHLGFPEELKPFFSLGVGDCVRYINEMDISYKSALSYLQHRYYKLATKIFSASNSSSVFMPIESQETYEIIAEKIKDYFYAAEKKLLEDSLLRLSKDLADKMILPHETHKVLTKIYLKIEGGSAKFSKISSDIYGREFSYMDSLKAFDGLKQAIGFTIKYYCKVADKVAECGGKSSKEIIEKVKKYILNNFKEDLSLEKVAEIVYINPNYLSEIFKCKTGENFVEHITRIRMEQAKKLLRDLEYKTYQVGQMVGYEDPSYFSKVFKKQSEYHQANTGI